MLLNNSYFDRMKSLRWSNFILILLFVVGNASFAQDADSIILKSIFNKELQSFNAFKNIQTLCTESPARITGSENSFKALRLMEKVMEAYKPETLYHQAVTVHRWERGDAETAYFISDILGRKNFKALAIGGSKATVSSGISANVIEVKGLSQLIAFGVEKIHVKIVFFNEAMDPTIINPGEAYGKEGYQRFHGAILAANYGAIGVIVRSLASVLDDNPHTGVMRYADTLPKIPAICISTLGADELSESLKNDPELHFCFKTNCRELPDIESYNLIAEIRGSEKPNEIIVIGAHLDSWDVNQGANDDGIGCAHVIETLRLFKEMNFRPKRTLRFVLFMDEEMYQTGANKFAEEIKAKSEKIYAALESDSGGDLLMGFGCACNDKQLFKFKNLAKYFIPYDITKFIHSYSETDLEPLEDLGIPLLNTRPNPQRYFKYHHSVRDTLQNIDERELQLTCAGITSLIYLIDKKDIF